jgi:serine/threonine protein kinase
MSEQGSPGPSLGRYHLAEPLGGGPTGEVFRAKVYGIAGLERQFAVKRFYAALTQDPETVTKIAAAANAYGTIEHPRIARLYEYGVSEEQSFVAIELVPGLDLSRIIAATVGVGEPLSLGASLSIVQQLSRALAYAHERGTLHLGVCPTNVVVTPDGDVKIMDFGFLCARLGARPQGDSTLAARLPYLAPEQLGGGTTSPATDVFQLATVAYELLTGQRTFAGGTMDSVAAKIRTGTPPEPPLPLPLPISAALRKAFAPDPDERYLDAGAFADALDAAIRMVPQPGGRSDVAAATKKAMSREDAAQPMSGAVSFPLPAPPQLMGTAPTVPLLSRPPSVTPRSHSATLLGVAVPAMPGGLDLPAPQGLAPPVEDLWGNFPPLPPPIPVTTPFPSPPPLPLASELLPSARAASPPSAARAALRKNAQWAAIAAGAVALCALGYLGMGRFLRGDHAGTTRPPSARATTAPPSADATTAVAAAFAPTARAVDAAPSVAPSPAAPSPRPPDDAPPLRPPDAAPPRPPDKPAPSVGREDILRFESDPPGADVYLDGALKGRTPLDLPPTGDRHRVALILPGHALHKGDIEGKGVISVVLAKATSTDGPAGIKVKCKSKDRFYVILNGKDTGQLCPTERIAVPLGDYVLEIYDPVTDSTTTHQVPVKDTHNSVRVKLDEP